MVGNVLDSYQLKRILIYCVQWFLYLRDRVQQILGYSILDEHSRRCPTTKGKSGKGPVNIRGRDCLQHCYWSMMNWNIERTPIAQSTVNFQSAPYLSTSFPNHSWIFFHLLHFASLSPLDLWSDMNTPINKPNIIKLLYIMYFPIYRCFCKWLTL